MRICGASRVISASDSRACSPPESWRTATFALSPEKPETAELRAHLAGLAAGNKPLHMLERRLVGDQLLDLMLGEIADPQFARRDDRARPRA